MINLVGGKGAKVGEMTYIGMNVPAAFTITTEACNSYFTNGNTITEEIVLQIEAKLAQLENLVGKWFGSLTNPLIVSVRSGARVSLPGMMDTILNVGLNDIIVEILARLTNDPQFAYDCYRRLIQMFGDVVKGIDKDLFEDALEELKAKRGVENDLELTAEDLKELVETFKAIYLKAIGSPFPQDPNMQMFGAIEAVFRSWNNDRAVEYRKKYGLPNDWGTAVTVQEMVFGNLGENSGTSVLFSRNRMTGKKELDGDYLRKGQGEDVVAGVRNTVDVSTLKQTNPELYDQLRKIANQLDAYFKDMQDIEITVENGVVYLLQTRDAKRSPSVALRVAIEQVEDGIWTKEQALLKLEANDISQVLLPQFDQNVLKSVKPVATGLGVSAGSAWGPVYFSAQAATEHKGEKPILIRKMTSAEDVKGFNVAVGVLTHTGGKGSHASLLASQNGIPCVVGCSAIELGGPDGKTPTGIAGHPLKEGDVLSIDGATGKVYLGKIPTVEVKEVPEDLKTVLSWANEIRSMKVYVNAETVTEFKRAIELGAQGSGLVRTEHTFFTDEGLPAMRAYIASQTEEEKTATLAVLEKLQQATFEGLFEAGGDGFPIVIRLLDPPKNEFAPASAEETAQVAVKLGRSVEETAAIFDALKEENPMMGLRGCRLLIVEKDLAAMQTRAIIQAALNVSQRHTGWKIKPKIMIPLVTGVAEVKAIKKIITKVADELTANDGHLRFQNTETGLPSVFDNSVQMEYSIGAMIETPMATWEADEIAAEVDFVSFGTNDLTQFSFGIGRDDGGTFLPTYYDEQVFLTDPFERLHSSIVKAVHMAVGLARGKNPDIEVGICGEHGGESSSIAFCNDEKFAYVSCASLKVPGAIIAAAQAELKRTLN